MTYRWSELYDLACALYEHPEQPGPRDASYRCAVSRAYYAVVHCARIFAEGADPEFRCNYLHSDVEDYFTTVGTDTHRAIGNRLRDMKQYRHSADYDDVLWKRWSAAYLASKTMALASKALKGLDSLQPDDE